jgi:hypothetical protein
VLFAAARIVSSRRGFLEWSLRTVSYAFTARTLHASALGAGLLRIATVTDPEQTDMERGLSFGAAEATRSAMLFGWRVVRVQAVESGAMAGVNALIMGRPGASPSQELPVLRLTCDAAHPDDGSFMLASCGAAGDVWQPTLERFGARQLNDRFRSATGAPMTSDAWLGWFAFKVLAETVLRAQSADPTVLRLSLAADNTHFDGHKGVTLRFDGGRRLVQPIYGRGSVERR